MLDLVEAHVRGRGYHVVRQDPDSTTRAAHPRIARIDRSPGYRAARVPLDAPLARDVIGAASEAAGEEPILAPTLGGSLPLYLFEEVLGTPAVGVPIANHDDNQHAPDENLRVGNLWYGIDLVAAIMTM
jgi:acetylornithine deacetylase/succinyl-diaminopimelate desuccinylase-like protein